MSKLVAKEEIDAVFATTNIMESISPLISSLTYGVFYNYTVAILPGAVFYLAGIFEALILCIAV